MFSFWNEPMVFRLRVHEWGCRETAFRGVYTTTPDTGTSMGTVPEYVTVNGVAEGAEGLSPASPSAPQDSASQAAYSLPQLKLMLSQQLEYYFSRSVNWRFCITLHHSATLF